MDINVGANSKIIDCRVANPISSFGINGLVKFNAVWIDTTPPTKKEMKATIPRESIIKSSISCAVFSSSSREWTWETIYFSYKNWNSFSW